MDPAGTSTLAATLIGLLPVIAGGVIGLVGGIVGARYTHGLTQEGSKVSDRKARLETLVNAAYELDLWLQKQENYYLFKGPESLEHSPLSKVETLVALYFPELEAQSTDLNTAVQNYRKWMLDGRAQVLDRNLPTPSKEHMEKLSEVYGPFLTARHALIGAAKRVMHALMAS